MAEANTPPVTNGAQSGVQGSNGGIISQTPGQPKLPAEKPPVSTASGTARAPDGKFAPRDKPLDATTGDGLQAQAEAVKEAYRFKRKLNVYGEEQDVDLGEDDIARELQIAAAARKKMKELAQREARVAEYDKIRKERPEALFETEDERLEFAKRTLAAAARRELMPPEERARMELEEERSRFSHEKQTWEQQRQQEQRDEQARRTWEKIAPEFETALTEAGLERSPKEMEAIADIGLEFVDAKLPLSPKDIVKEYLHREERGFKKRLSGVEPAKLRASLSDEQWAGLKKLMVSEYKEKHAGFQQRPREEPVHREKEEAGRKFLSETEFKRLMRG